MNKLLRNSILILMMLTGFAAKAQDYETFHIGDLVFMITSEADRTVKLHNYYEETTASAWIKRTVIYSGAVVIPETVTFKNKVYTVTEIGELAFYKSTATEVVIPATVKYVRSFPGNTLEKVTIEESDSILYFGSYYLNGGKDWYIGRNIMREGHSTYDDNFIHSIFSKAEAITISDKVTQLHERQFYQCYNLRKLVLGNGITEIPEGLCAYGPKLKSVIIPRSVVKICNNAFSGCQISDITIPNTVMVIEKVAFYQNGCFNNFSFEDSDTPLLLDIPIGTVTFTDSIKNLYVGRDISYEGGSYQYIFPSAINIVFGDKVTKVNKRFSTGILESVVLGRNISTIDDYAFYGAKKLKSVDIPASVKNIGKGAFDGCTNLSSLVLHEGLETIEESAFISCDSLKEITIPASVQEIGNYAFRHYSGMNRVTIENSDKTLTLGSGWHEITIMNLYLGRNVISESDFGNTYNVVVGDLVNEIPERMFSVGKIETAILGKSVEKIGYYAFGNTKLKAIELPASLRIIADYAFYGCDSLKILKLNEGLDSIGDNAFRSCYSLQELTIPASVRTIGNQAFYDCSKVQSLTISDSKTPLNIEVLSSGYGPLPSSCIYLYLGRDLSKSDESSYGMSFYNVEELVFGEYVTRLYVDKSSDNNRMFHNSRSLKTVTAPWVIPFAIDDNDFSSTAYQNATLLVKNGTQQTYANTNGWKNFFNIKAYAYNVTAETNEGGTLKLLEQMVVKDSPLATTVKTSTSFSVLITPHEGYELKSLTINDIEHREEITNNTLYINNVENDIIIKAVFEKKTFPVTAFVAKGGYLTIDGKNTEEGKTLTVTAKWEDSIEVTVTEDEDYLLDAIMVNDIDVTEQLVDGILTISNVREAKNIVATFKQSVLKHLRITDGERYEMTENFKTQKLTYKRNFSNTTDWDILLLPVSLNYEDWKDKMEIAHIYDVNIYDRNHDGQVDYTEIEAIALKEGSETQPNYPYFVRGKQEGEITISRGETEVARPEIYTLECANTIQTFTLTGCYDGLSAQELIDNKLYTMKNGVWTFADIDAIDLPYMRAYLSVVKKDINYGKAASAREIYIKIIDGEDVTGIKCVGGSETSINKPLFYNVSGVRTTNPTKGIYIMNGKKVVLK